MAEWLRTDRAVCCPAAIVHQQVRPFFSTLLPRHSKLSISSLKGVITNAWLNSGIYTSGNYAAEGLNSTYLRDIQLTDHDGVASFETIFPGHYDGRAIHNHLLAHTNAAVEPNGTISVWDAPVDHIGQVFWDDDLRAEFEATYPYTQNEQALTTNDEDMWSIVQADSSYDPLPKYLRYFNLYIDKQLLTDRH
jgi:hypothetical protein